MTVVKLRSPSEKFELIIKIVRFSASICGIDVLKANYRFNFVTYTMIIGVAGYYLFIFLTIWNNYHDDWTIVLKATATMGSACQGVSKLISFIPKRKMINDMYQILSATYSSYEKMGEKYRDGLERSLQKTTQGAFILMIVYVIGYLGIVIVPYLILMATGEKALVLELEVPGLDSKTHFGYICTMVFQTGLVIVCAFGLFCGDLFALVFLLQSFTFSYILAAKIEYFNEMVEDPANNTKPGVTHAILDIIKWHQTFTDFTTSCNDLFYYVITVQIVTAFCSTVISVYLIVAGGWPGAYVYVVVALSCLYLYCILGSENQTANTEFEHGIYNIHWYNLTVPQQKLILQVLFKTQHPKIIDVAGVMPLSVSTALQITKTVYSITMMMIRFFME